MNREEVVIERGHRAPKPTLQPADLADAAGEAAPKYLTSRQLAAYLGFRGKTPECSANKFVKRHGLRRYWRSQRAALVLRADVDRVLEGKVAWRGHDATMGR